jgi:predicted phage terminase large subunit-like protein
MASHKKQKELLQKQLELQQLRDYKKQVQADKERLAKITNYAKAEKSLYEYHKLTWNFHVPQPFIDNWHIGAICEHLQALHNREFRNLIINIPPRFAKSTICSISFPTWAWINKPEEQFMTTSYSDDIVLRDSTRSRSLIQHEWYQEGWGHRFELRKNVNQKSRYENNLGGYRIASTIGAGKQLGEGYTCLIVDDPLKSIEAFNKAACSKVIDWWKYTISTRANTDNAVRLIIMQRLSEMDLVEHILKEDAQEEDWYHLCLPMRYEKRPKYVTRSPLKFVDPRTEEGELLCPKYQNEAKVRILESQLGKYGTAAQLQQRPAPIGGGLIKEDDIKFYAQSISPYQYPILFHYLISSWDFNFGDENQTSNNSFCVGQVWGFGKDQRYYLLHQTKGHWSFTEQIDAIKRMNKMFPQIRYNIIEQMATGSAAIDTIRKELPRLNVQGIKPKDFNWGGNKQNTKLLRVNAYLPVFENNKVWIPSKSIAPWVLEYVQELVTFPASQYDDQIDATVLALMWFESKNLMKGTGIDISEELRRTEQERRFYNTQDVNKGRINTATSIALSAFDKPRNIF